MSASVTPPCPGGHVCHPDEGELCPVCAAIDAAPPSTEPGRTERARVLHCWKDKREHAIEVHGYPLPTPAEIWERIAQRRMEVGRG